MRYVCMHMLYKHAVLKRPSLFIAIKWKKNVQHENSHNRREILKNQNVAISDKL